MAAVWEPDPAGVYFSDEFDVDPALLEEYGALDMSVVTDLPLFTDPFLLFNSENPIYQASHEQIIGYLRFLRSKANVPLDRNLVAAWYQFGEVKQNWLGFTEDGNSGHGLGAGFAAALHGALTTLLDNLGAETVTDQAVADGERAHVGAQPQHGGGDFLGFAHAPDRFLADDAFAAFGAAAGESVHHRVSMMPGQIALIRMPAAA